VLVDVGCFWRKLSVAHWLNRHSDYYCRHMFGDQDTWHMALVATGRQYRIVGDARWRKIWFPPSSRQAPSPYRMVGDARWRKIAFVCDYASRTTIVHRCRAKLFGGNPRRFDGLPEAVRDPHQRT
jgi:hypothetical protein